MRIYITTLIFFIASLLVNVTAQEALPLKKEDIVGRWTELKRIEGENVKPAGDRGDTYIFREDMTFHKGEVSEGIILFNVAGRYEIKDNSVIIYYRDYIQKNAAKEKAKELIFNILEKSEKEIVVLVSDYSYQYKMVLKK